MSKVLEAVKERDWILEEAELKSLASIKLWQ